MSNLPGFLFLRAVASAAALSFFCLPIFQTATAAVSTQTQVVLTSGMSVPGDTALFAGLPSRSAPVINDAGQLSFRANLVGAGIDSSNDEGLFHFDGTQVIELARKGQMPPLGAGTFSTVGNPQLTNTGDTFFNARHDTGAGVQDLGAYRAQANSGLVTRIARTGQPIPDGTADFDAVIGPWANHAG